MSTRCQVAFYENANEKDLRKFHTLIYRHSDGYPEEPGVLNDLKEFFKKWIPTGRIADVEYTSARCLQFLTNLYDEQTRKFDKQLKNKRSNKMIDTGYGISNQFHIDIEYLYAIYPDRIDVYEVDCSDKDIIRRVALTEYTYKF